MTSGTRAKSPSRIASSGSRGSSRPSMMGPPPHAGQQQQAAPELQRVDDVVGGRAAQARRNIGAIAADRRGERIPLRVGRLRGEVQRVGARAALDDRAREQAAAAGHGELRAHAPRACGLAVDRDVARIAAERGDVALDPRQRRALVEEPDGRQGLAPLLSGERALRQEAERAEPVVDRHDDRVRAPRQPGTVEQLVAAAAAIERAAVDPDQHRQVRPARRPHVEVQAILGRPGAPGLRAGGPGLRRVARCRPWRHRAGRLPSRRGRVRDAQECAHTVVVVADHGAAIGRDRGRR
jgi:hypothetical protein